MPTWGSARLLITVPLMALPLTMLSVSHAKAAGVAEEAVLLLSKARAADGNCNYLSSPERSELGRYLARAEIAAASQSGAGAAKAAVSTGMAQGKAAPCSADLQADVRETLAAAREAAASAREHAEPSNKPVVARAETSDDGQAEMRGKAGGLQFYKRAVQAYYLERECRSLSNVQAKRFWAGIVRLHKVTVAANGAAAVAPVMRGAERRARSSSCGNRAMAEIRHGYETTVSR